MKPITPKQLKQIKTPKKRVKKTNTEEHEQKLLCEWVKKNYPNVLYTVDLGGIRLTMGQRVVMKSRAKRGHPDLMFQEWFLDKYCGLAIEFKRTGTQLFKLDGTLRKDEHHEEQLSYLIALKERYWLAGFVVGLEPAKEVIKAYLEAHDTSLSIINKHIYPKLKTINQNIKTK
jgi:hypothetical protein